MDDLLVHIDCVSMKIRREHGINMSNVLRKKLATEAAEKITDDPLVCGRKGNLLLVTDSTRNLGPMKSSRKPPLNAKAKTTVQQVQDKMRQDNTTTAAAGITILDSMVTVESLEETVN